MIFHIFSLNVTVILIYFILFFNIPSTIWFSHVIPHVIRNSHIFHRTIFCCVSHIVTNLINYNIVSIVKPCLIYMCSVISSYMPKVVALITHNTILDNIGSSNWSINCKVSSSKYSTIIIIESRFFIFNRSITKSIKIITITRKDLNK